MSPVKPKRRQKTTGKSAEIPKVPQPHGGALNAGGTPGNAGGGRPPKAFKDFLAELRKDQTAQEVLKAVATDAGNKNCVAAWKLIADYDDEKPAKKLELTAPMSNADRAGAIRRLLEKVKA